MSAAWHQFFAPSYRSEKIVFFPLNKDYFLFVLCHDTNGTIYPSKKKLSVESKCLLYKFSNLPVQYLHNFG